jgi:hypothetical protein
MVETRVRRDAVTSPQGKSVGMWICRIKRLNTEEGVAPELSTAALAAANKMRSKHLKNLVEAGDLNARPPAPKRIRASRESALFSMISVFNDMRSAC